MTTGNAARVLFGAEIDAYRAGVNDERNRICAMAGRLEMAFREFVGEGEAAGCALRAVEMIRGDRD